MDAALVIPAEISKPTVALRQMTEGHNVVADYGHVGLTLREHPIAFLRKELAARRIVICAEAMNARDGRWLMTAGLVLVRQKPGSEKGVMFITIEDETGPANLVVWPSLFERRRRVRSRIVDDGDQRPHSARRMLPIEAPGALTELVVPWLRKLRAHLT